MEQDVVQTRVSDTAVSPRAILASDDGRWILWAGAEGTRTGMQLVGAWSRTSHRVTIVARLAQDARVMHLGLADRTVYAIDAVGQAFAWPLPAEGDGQPARSSVVSADDLARERAIVQLGLGEPWAALQDLERVTAPDAREADRFLRAYVRSLADREDGGAFRARVAREGIRYAGANATLASAAALASAEVVFTAVDLFAYWLDGARPGSRDEAGVDVGLEIAQLLGEADDDESRAVLLRRLRAVYPSNERVDAAVRDLEE